MRSSLGKRGLKSIWGQELDIYQGPKAEVGWTQKERDWRAVRLELGELWDIDCEDDSGRSDWARV